MKIKKALKLSITKFISWKIEPRLNVDEIVPDKKTLIAQININIEDNIELRVVIFNFKVWFLKNVVNTAQKTSSAIPIK